MNYAKRSEWRKSREPRECAKCEDERSFKENSC